jgi:hypothetical protein
MRSSPGRAADAPDILLLLSDDHTWSTTVYPQLVDQGTLFDRAYVQTSLCCPSRSEILTELDERHPGSTTTSWPGSTDRRGAARSGPRHHAGREVPEQRAVHAAPGVRPVGVRREDPVGNPADEPLSRRRRHDAAVHRAPTDDPRERRRVLHSRLRRNRYAMYTPTTPHLPADDPRYESMPVKAIPSPAFDQGDANDRDCTSRRDRLRSVRQSDTNFAPRRPNGRGRNRHR